MPDNYSTNYPDASAPEQGTVAMIEVIAPATLAEGYEFDALYEGRTFTVIVPSGGVVKGQRFSAPLKPSRTHANGETSAVIDDDDTTTPLGHWKDGLCDCLKFGPIHPSFIYAWLCPQILVAQVMTRMRLNWLAEVTSDEERRKTFKRILYIVIAYWILVTVFRPTPQHYEKDSSGNFVRDERGHFVPVGPHPSAFLVLMNNLINVTFSLYSIMVVMRTRRSVRERYEIPEERCIGCEDLCCSFWCGCCTVSQLARQTTDYGAKRALWCTNTGLPVSTPVMVV